MSFKPTVVIVAVLIAVLIARSSYGQVPGGVKSIPQDDATMLKVLNNAIYLYNNQDHQGLTHHMRLGEIREAKEQVVAGMKYVIDFDFLHTKCRKEDRFLSRSEFDNCEHDKSKKTHKCQTTLFHQPWNKESPITIDQLNCENQYWS